MGSPAALLCLAVAPHQWQSLVVSQLNLLLAAGSVSPVTNSQLWEKENGTIASRVHLEEIIVLQPRALTVFALHSRSTIENERGNN